jgi:hypothetical protein
MSQGSSDFCEPNTHAPFYLTKGNHEKECKKSYFIQCLAITESSKCIIVPECASFMKVLLIGGGGAGGRFQASDSAVANGGGGGGGAGTYINNCFEVCPGKTFDVIIGAGGIDTGDNGDDGGNTILKYDCTTKIANGGKGGGFGLTGGVGGRGGVGTGNGQNGIAGGNGSPLVGGAGGTARNNTCPTSMYGNGGKGGSSVTPAPTVTVTTVQAINFNSLTGSQTTPANLSISASNRGGAAAVCQYTQGILAARQSSKCQSFKCLPRKGCWARCSDIKTSECKCHKDDKDCMKCSCCPAELPTLDLSPLGSSGLQGYAEIEFYSWCPPCCESRLCCESKVQHIHPCREDFKSDPFLHYIDVNANVVIANSTDISLNLFLPKPSQPGTEITIKMKYQAGNSINIQTATGGTFTIDASNPSVTLAFGNCVWDLIDNPANVHSFYPTTRQGPTIIFPTSTTNTLPYIDSDLSADGNTAAIGFPDYNNGVGAVFIYVRHGCSWKLQAILQGTDAFQIPPVNPSDPPLPIFQGISVALSADGNTVAFGGPGDNDFTGAAWVFVRCVKSCTRVHHCDSNCVKSCSKTHHCDSNCSKSCSKTHHCDSSCTKSCHKTHHCDSKCSKSCSKTHHCDSKCSKNCCKVHHCDSKCTRTCSKSHHCDSNCNKTCSKTHHCDSNCSKTCSKTHHCDSGCTKACHKTHHCDSSCATVTWRQQGPKLVGSGSTFNDNVGFSLDLTADGNTLFVGAPGYLSTTTNNGSVLIFSRNNCTWTETNRIIGTFADNTGQEVVTDADGTTLAARGIVITVYILVAGMWVVETVITPLDLLYLYNNTMSISADGDTLAVGDIANNSGVGGVTIYVRVAGVWNVEAPMLAGNDSIGAALQGFSTNLSADGNTLAFGGVSDNNLIGAVWIFTRVKGIWTQREKLIPTSSIPAFLRGGSVSLSSEANTLLVTNLPQVGNVGQAWIYV